MSAISTRVTAENYHPDHRVHIADYPSDLLRKEYGEGVRPFDQVLNENYGPEHYGWEYRQPDVASKLGEIVIFAAGDAYAADRRAAKRQPSV
jgi:hypothetical protein